MWTVAIPQGSARERNFRYTSQSVTVSQSVSFTVPIISAQLAKSCHIQQKVAPMISPKAEMSWTRDEYHERKGRAPAVSMLCEHFAVRILMKMVRILMKMVSALYNHALLKHPVPRARMIHDRRERPSSHRAISSSDLGSYAMVMSQS